MTDDKAHRGADLRWIEEALRESLARAHRNAETFAALCVSPSFWVSSPVSPWKGSHSNSRMRTPTDFDERRDKGLCLWCDENYEESHQCKKKRQSFYVIEVGDDVEEVENDTECLIASINCHSADWNDWQKDAKKVFDELLVYPEEILFKGERCLRKLYNLVGGHNSYSTRRQFFLRETDVCVELEFVTSLVFVGNDELIKIFDPQQFRLLVTDRMCYNIVECVVHGAVSFIRFNSNVFICNALVAVYVRCSELDDTRQVEEDGYEFFADRQLVIIFSATIFCGEFNNAGAMISGDEHIGFALENVQRRNECLELIMGAPSEMSTLILEDKDGLEETAVARSRKVGHLAKDQVIGQMSERIDVVTTEIPQLVES